MIDWTKSMQQTYEFYIVDPMSWRDRARIQTIETATITRDDAVDTLGSASFDITEDIGEQYVRTYLVANQNGNSERYPLGTHLLQPPSDTFSGMRRKITSDGYTPLIELKEKQPPIGFYIRKNASIMSVVRSRTIDNLRAPVGVVDDDHTMFTNFVSENNDTWFSYLSSAMAQAKYSYGLDENGKIIFRPDISFDALQPLWTYTDDNSSLLYPEITTDHDIFGIPNVVEVLHSSTGKTYFATVTNDDPSSPTSTVRRGRSIIYRAINPDIPGMESAGSGNQRMVNEYAKNLLKAMSAVEYRVTYKHGFFTTDDGKQLVPGDCVRLNYRRAGLENVKAKIISQTVSCTPGCPIEETAVFTKNLWR